MLKTGRCCGETTRRAGGFHGKVVVDALDGRQRRKRTTTITRSGQPYGSSEMNQILKVLCYTALRSRVLFDNSQLKRNFNQVEQIPKIPVFGR
jgi:hypothetical protein